MQVGFIFFLSHLTLTPGYLCCNSLRLLTVRRVSIFQSADYDIKIFAITWISGGLRQWRDYEAKSRPPPPQVEG